MPKEPYCKNCRLYDSQKGECQVIILHEGKKYNLPVSPNDPCFFENQFISKKPEFNKTGDLAGVTTEKWKPEVQEVKFWVEDPKNGQKTTGKGIVKIEYPQGFFGEED